MTARLAFVTFLVAVGTGCGRAPTVGLKAIHPPIERGLLALQTDYVEVASLEPELRWEALEGIEGATDVSYEIRVWQSLPGDVGPLIYRREGLTGTAHRIDEPLQPSTGYLWSVRAHFTLDGRPRATEWGLAGQMLREHTVPNPSCFRFATPAPPDPS